MMAAFMVRWNLSTAPLACGWYEVEPSKFDRSLHNWFVNSLPLSDNTSVGIPKFATHPDQNALATVVAVLSGIGMAIGHLVNLSTAVNTYIKPLLNAIGPTRSMLTCANRPDGGVYSFSGALMCVVTFERWHGRHFFVHWATS
jgi:hypothetical protein